MHASASSYKLRLISCNISAELRGTKKNAKQCEAITHRHTPNTYTLHTGKHTWRELARKENYNSSHDVVTLYEPNLLILDLDRGCLASLLTCKSVCACVCVCVLACAVRFFCASADSSHCQPAIHPSIQTRRQTSQHTKPSPVYVISARDTSHAGSHSRVRLSRLHVKIIFSTK